MGPKADDSGHHRRRLRQQTSARTLGFLLAKLACHRLAPEQPGAGRLWPQGALLFRADPAPTAELEPTQREMADFLSLDPSQIVGLD